MSNVMTMNASDSKPTLASHAVFLRFHQGHLDVFLVRDLTKNDERQWTLPTAIVQPGESLLQAVGRTLQIDDDNSPIEFAEFGSFVPNLAPEKEWLVGIGLLGLVQGDFDLTLDERGQQTAWHPLANLPDLEQYHSHIVRSAMLHLRQRISIDTFPMALLPKKFRTKQVRHLYAQILGDRVSPRPFKAWLQRRKAVTRTGPSMFTRNETLRHDWLLDWSD